MPGHRFLWNGSGTNLGAASDWSDLTTGATASPVVPTYGDTATFGPVGSVTATGTASIGLTTLAADLLLQGRLVTGGITLANGTLELGATAQVVIRTSTLKNGVATLGAGGKIGGTGRINGTVDLIAATATLLASGGALAVFGTVLGTGTMAIGNGATLFDVGTVAAGVTAAFQGASGTLELYAATAAQFGATIAGFAGADALDIAGGIYTTATWNAGTLTLGAADGGTLALLVAGSYIPTGFIALPDGLGGTVVRLAPATFSLPSSTGALTLGQPAALTLASGLGTAGVVTAAGTVALTGTLQAGSMTQSGLLAVQSGACLAAGTLAVSGQVLDLAGGSITATAVTLNGGTISVDPQAQLAIGASTVGSGTLGIAGGATLSGGGRVNAALTCDGVIAAAGGALGLFGDVAGRGTLAIGSGGILFAAGAIAPGLTVSFAAPGVVLSLFAPGTCAGLLTGFQPGDAIDIAIPLDAVHWSPGMLTLSAGGIDHARIPIAGDYQAARFTLQPDSMGGTLIGVVACFVAGTRIATPEGERPVESLRPGDLVSTPLGRRRLCWTGSRVVDAPSAPETRPVVIRAGALGNGLPRRDLWLSPQHAVRIGEVLVPAVALLAPPHVERAPAGVAAYHHLGLNPHGLVLAEGVMTETYLPGPEADLFGQECGIRPRTGASCLPRLEQGVALEALRATLFPAPATRPSGPLRGHLERIVADGAAWRLEGWACDAHADAPVALRLLRDEVAIGLVVANLWRPDLDRAGLRDGRCAFSVVVEGSRDGLRLVRAEDGTPLPNSTGAMPQPHRIPDSPGAG